MNNYINKFSCWYIEITCQVNLCRIRYISISKQSRSWSGSSDKSSLIWVCSVCKSIKGKGLNITCVWGAQEKRLTEMVIVLLRIQSNIQNICFGWKIDKIPWGLCILQLFRKDLISAMKLPDSESLATEDYLLIADSWRQEWERGVQVPVNEVGIPDVDLRWGQT